MDIPTISDRIYEAAVLPEMWPGILEDIAKSIGCAGGTVFVGSDRHVDRWISSAGVAELMAAFVATGGAKDNLRARRAVEMRHPGFGTDDEILTPDEMDHDPTYVSVYRALGFGWAAGTVIHTPTRDMAVISFERRFADGPVPREHLVPLNALRPNLARGVVLATRLALKAAQSSASTLSSVGIPAAILDARGRVLAANDLLTRLRDQFDIAAFDRPRFLHPATQALFMGALDAMNESQTIRSFPVAATDENLPSVGHVIPVKRAAQDVFSRSSFILMLTPLQANSPNLDQLLTGLFDLTPRESQIVNMMLAGKSVPEIARDLSISRETCKTHLKRIFAKTGTSRQAELLSILSRVPVLGDD